MTPVSIRLSLIVGALYVGFGAHLPFFGLWLAERGLSSTEVALALGAPLFARVVAAPPLTVLADRLGDPAIAIRMFSIFVGLFYMILPWLSGFWPIFLASLLAGLVWGTIVPLTDSLTVAAERRGEADYGQVRLWGSVGFIVTAILMGWLIDYAGLWVVPPVVVLSMFAMLIILGKPPNGGAPTAPRSLTAGLRVLWTDKVLLLLILALACGHASHGMFYTIGGIHWRSLGYSEGIIGMLWAMGVIVEIAFLAVSTRIIARFGVMVVLAAGLACGVLRWGVMAFDPPLGFMFVWQVLHALSFAAVLAAGINIVAGRFTPEMSSSGQGTYYALVGLCHGLTMIISGPLYDAFLGKAYLAMAATCLAGLVLLCVALGRDRRINP
jgi:MFS transporter, PPP family, 3-phenylpropionic acid transporter